MPSAFQGVGARLQALLATHGRAGAQAVCDRIWRALQDYCSAQVQQDDITLLAVRAA